MVPWHTSTNGFRDGLKEFGYVEGKNIIFEARAAQGDLTHLPKLAAELLEQKPDLLFCVSDTCSREIGRAADEVRVHHQYECRKTDRIDDSAECAGASGQGDQVKRGEYRVSSGSRQ
jgi:hypothetical protein